MATPRQRPKLSPDQRAFIEWLVAPVQEPSTQYAYAAQTNTAPKTLTNWKNLPEFREEWDRRLQELNVDPERVQEVMDALHIKAKGGDVRAIKLYLEVIDRFRPKVEVEVTRASDLTDEQLAELLEQAAGDELAERREKSA